MRLGTGTGITRAAGARNRAPTDIAWAGSHTVAEDAALGTQVGGALSFVDPNAEDTGTFTLADDAGGRFAIGGDGASIIVAGVLDYEAATSHGITIRFTDAGGLAYQEAFTVTVSNVAEDAPENPPPSDPPAVVDDEDRYDVLPYTTVVDGSVKFAGKKKNDGQSAKMLMDFNGATPPLTLAANKVYTIHITLDAHLMAAQGALAVVGIALKHGNDFWMVGAKGPATANAVQEYGAGKWTQQSGFTEVDGGDIQHGSQLDLWLQLETSADGETITARSSADGNTFDDEFTDATLGPLADVTEATQWGPAAIFHSADSGPFSFNVEYWSAESAFVPRQFMTPDGAMMNTVSPRQWMSSGGAYVNEV